MRMWSRPSATCCSISTQPVGGACDACRNMDLVPIWIPEMVQAAGWKSELWLDAVDAGSGEAAAKRRWAGLPAIGQLTVSRPEVLRAFKAYNASHPSAR